MLDRLMLSDDQLQQFAADGYVLVRGAITDELLEAVDREIDDVVAEDPPDSGTTGTHFHFLGPERLRAADDALRSSEALSYAEQLTELERGAGNLWVWPGSHLAHAEPFGSKGTDALKTTGGHSAMLDPPLGIGDPIPVLANRGDLLFAHYLLGHNSGGNTTSVTRRAVYYRLSTRDLDDRWEATLADPFLEYPAIRPEPTSH